MKRTLLLTLEYPPQKGGIAAYLSSLVTHLSSTDISVLCNGNKRQNFDKVTMVPFYSSTVWPRWIPAIWLTLRHMFKQDIDQLWVSHILPLGTVAYIIHKMTGTPYIVSLHGMDINMLRPRSKKGFLAKRILKNAKAITANSSFTKKTIEQFGIDGERIQLIYPCPGITPVGNIETIVKKKEGDTVILAVARLVKRKGQDKLIEAMPNLLEHHPNTQLWLVGKGQDDKYLQKLADKSPAKPNIRFFGEVSDAEVRGLYNQADIFAMPSRTLKNKDTEGFGIVYLEANLFGLPVVGGNTGGIPDAVEHGKTGFLVDGEDIDALTKTIQYLIEHPEERLKMGSVGKKRAQELFKWSIQAEKLKQLLV